jgi:CHAD domain-containing protein
MAKAWPVPGLGARDSFRTAGGRVLQTRAAEVLAYRDAARTQGGVEDVHDLRVAIRRLRANFDAFRDALDPAGYEDRRVRLRDLARMLGEVRDADVLAGMLERRLEQAGEDAPEAPALRVLLDEALGEARRDRAARLEAAAGDRLGAAIADLQRFVADQTMVTADEFGMDAADQEPVPPEPAEQRSRTRRAHPDRRVGPGLATLLRRRLKQVRAADDAVTGPDDSAGLHQLRIRIKRLRYLAEVGALISPSAAHDEFLGMLGDLQDALGEVHDADVLADLAREHETAGGDVPAAAWEALAGAVGGERATQLRTAEDLLGPVRAASWKPVRAMAKELDAAH